MKVHDHTSASSLRRQPARARAPAVRRRAGQPLGQHFLRDLAVCERIARAARVAPGDAVLEVGPGRGALTRRLVSDASPLVLVELDDELAALLSHRYRNAASVRVINADARDLDIAGISELAGRPYKVVANLPYYAASPIVRMFLESAHAPAEMVVMMQREVALEMAAPTGKRGLLSVATQFYAEAEVLFDVPPEAFQPPPKVTSAVVRLTLRPSPLLDVKSPDEFFDLVRAGFRARRKQLGNSLARGLQIEPPVARELLAKAGIDPVRRPSTLSIPEWGALYDAWAGRDDAAAADGV